MDSEELSLKEKKQIGVIQQLKDHGALDIHVPSAIIPLTLLCLNTGFIDAITFSATFIWPGFQTGNTVQLSIALARTFAPGPQERHGFEYPDALALCSVLTFNLGALLCRLWPGSYKSRSWLVVCTFAQAVFTCMAGVTALYSDMSSFAGSRGEPSWTNVLGFVTMAFLSMTMGAQGVMGTKLASPYATTVVLTSVFCNLALEPSLFTLTKLVPSREQKFVAVAATFIGGLFARSVMAKIGASNALFIGAALRLITSGSWLLVKEKKIAAS